MDAHNANVFYMNDRSQNFRDGIMTGIKKLHGLDRGLEYICR